MSKFISSIVNCFLRPRDDQATVLFHFPGGEHEGLCEVNLNGYAIVPVEHYNALLVKCGEDPLPNQVH